MKDENATVDLRNNGCSIKFGNNRTDGKNPPDHAEKVENGDEVEVRIGGHGIRVLSVESTGVGKWQGKIGYIEEGEEWCKGLTDGQRIEFTEDHIFSCEKRGGL